MSPFVFRKHSPSIRSVITVGLLALMSMVATVAMAQGRTGAHDSHAAIAHAMPVGFGPGAGMGGGLMGGRGMDRILDRVNATPDQRSQIKRIQEAAAADLRKLHEASSSLRQQGLSVFTAPNVDANAAEALRQQMMQQHDQASRRRMQAMVEASRVLTPDQRKQLGELAQRRGEMMRRHRMEREQMGSPAMPRS